MTVIFLISLLVLSPVMGQEEGVEHSGDGEEVDGSGNDNIDDVQGSGSSEIEEISSDSNDYEMLETSEEVLDSSKDENDADETSENDNNPSCKQSPFGCCANSNLPAHGSRQEGCCLLSDHGCCPDNIREAQGPNGEGCGCETSEFGCCPDDKTPKRSEDNGCGCAYLEFGCCQDQYTPAKGENHEGCPCHTFDFGCCKDGETVANGPNKEGCPGCESSEFGCCPDQFTPANGPDGEGCGCAGSEHGCCFNGKTLAEGPEFQGCPMTLTDTCSLDKEKGKCEDFSIRWYFDRKEGRCSRFWYGGCDGNNNNFADLKTCEKTCVSPPGSGKCYLPKVTGICDGHYERFYYDHTYKQCLEFGYGGCLGNENKFKTKIDCEDACVRSDNIAVCEQPVEAGPCMGNYSRWGYNDETGLCELFAYGGCQGNKNRFITKDECENSCRHKKILLDATNLCRQSIETGNCNESIARWAFNADKKKCEPFYYSGCDGNSNNFESLEVCMHSCPDAFPPELEVVNKKLNVEEGKVAVLEIAVEGNPFPEITWKKDSEVIEVEDRFSLREDKSLVISEVSMEDAGSWMVVAHNGIGKVARKQISLSVYPSQVPVTVEIPLENRTFETGADIRLECKAEGFPIPRITWLKNNARLPKSKRIYQEDEKFLNIHRASPIDGGVYICKAENENMQNQAAVDITVLKGKVPVQCIDMNHLANCKIIVKYQLCGKNPNLAKLCCKSCMESGQIAGPPAK